MWQPCPSRLQLSTWLTAPDLNPTQLLSSYPVDSLPAITMTDSLSVICHGLWNAVILRLLRSTSCFPPLPVHTANITTHVSSACLVCLVVLHTPTTVTWDNSVWLRVRWCWKLQKNLLSCLPRSAEWSASSHKGSVHCTQIRPKEPVHWFLKLSLLMRFSS